MSRERYSSYVSNANVIGLASMSQATVKPDALTLQYLQCMAWQSLARCSPQGLPAWLVTGVQQGYQGITKALHASEECLGSLTLAIDWVLGIRLDILCNYEISARVGRRSHSVGADPAQTRV